MKNAIVMVCSTKLHNIKETVMDYLQSIYSGEKSRVSH